MSSTRDMDLAWSNKDLRTKSCSGVEFSTSGRAYTDTGKASGNLGDKVNCNHGLTFTQKWNWDNTLGTEISWENEGLKLTLDTIFVPNTGKKSGKLKASYKRDCFSLGSNVDIDFSGPTIYGWAVLAFWRLACWLSRWVLTQPNPNCHRTVSP